jgi:hypothetical protein
MNAPITMRCHMPLCGRVYEVAVECPNCGAALSPMKVLWGTAGLTNAATSRYLYLLEEEAKRLRELGPAEIVAWIGKSECRRQRARKALNLPKGYHWTQHAKAPRASRARARKRVTERPAPPPSIDHVDDGLGAFDAILVGNDELVELDRLFDSEPPELAVPRTRRRKPPA